MPISRHLVNRYAPPSGASSSPPPPSSPPTELPSTVKVTKMPKKPFHSRSARSHVHGDLASTMCSSTKMAGITYRPNCATSHYQSIIADPARSTSIPVIFDEPHSGSSWSIIQCDKLDKKERLETEQSWASDQEEDSKSPPRFRVTYSPALHDNILNLNPPQQVIDRYEAGKDDPEYHADLDRRYKAMLKAQAEAKRQEEAEALQKNISRASEWPKSFSPAPGGGFRFPHPSRNAELAKETTAKSMPSDSDPEASLPSPSTLCLDEGVKAKHAETTKLCTEKLISEQMHEPVLIGDEDDCGSACSEVAANLCPAVGGLCGAKLEPGSLLCEIHAVAEYARYRSPYVQAASDSSDGLVINDALEPKRNETSCLETPAVSPDPRNLQFSEGSGKDIRDEPQRPDPGQGPCTSKTSVVEPSSEVRQATENLKQAQLSIMAQQYAVGLGYATAVHGPVALDASKYMDLNFQLQIIASPTSTQEDRYKAVGWIGKIMKYSGGGGVKPMQAGSTLRPEFPVHAPHAVAAQVLDNTNSTMLSDVHKTVIKTHAMLKLREKQAMADRFARIEAQLVERDQPVTVPHSMVDEIKGIKARLDSLEGVDSPRLADLEDRICFASEVQQVMRDDRSDLDDKANGLSRKINQHVALPEHGREGWGAPVPRVNTTQSEKHFGSGGERSTATHGLHADAAAPSLHGNRVGESKSPDRIHTEDHDRWAAFDVASPPRHELRKWGTSAPLENTQTPPVRTAKVADPFGTGQHSGSACSKGSLMESFLQSSKDLSSPPITKGLAGGWDRTASEVSWVNDSGERDKAGWVTSPQGWIYNPSGATAARVPRNSSARSGGTRHDRDLQNAFEVFWSLYRSKMNTSAPGGPIDVYNTVFPDENDKTRKSWRNICEHCGGARSDCGGCHWYDDNYYGIGSEP